MLVLIRGGGDLASGVAYRLLRSGMRVVITELPQPLAIRRSVSFAEAVYEGKITIEGISAILVRSSNDSETIHKLISQEIIPVLIDPDLDVFSTLLPSVIVDARMLKQRFNYPKIGIPLLIGLGPGFIAGENCHAVIETQRGHTLGRVYWSGSGLKNTGIPDGVLGEAEKRVLRSPGNGKLQAIAAIGDQVIKDQPIAQVNGEIIRSPFGGVLRGLIKDGLDVLSGMKIGDIDPRNDPKLCSLISDKALAIGGGVLEAILNRHDLRHQLWN